MDSRFFKESLGITTHTPHGDEQKACVVNLKICTLQPTPPHGDEPSAMEAPLKAVSFQPTPRMGMNLISSCILAPYFLFQSTPPYGDEQKIVWQSRVNEANFNPHPRMGMNDFV